MEPKRRKKIGVSTFYLELVTLLLRCVEIPWGFWAFSVFMHKEINNKNSSKNEHLYTSVDVNLNSLLCETQKKGKHFFLKKLYIIELRNKN